MTLPRAEFALPEARATRRAFDRAAKTFNAASVVHDETRVRLLERLDFVRLAPAAILDLGCAAGDGAHALKLRYPAAQVIAVDMSLPMLHAARNLASAGDEASFIAADAERLPVMNGAIDLIFANMLLPWTRPQQIFTESARVLGEGGLLVFATLGPDSLQQLRRAWAAVDDGVHVHAFFDMHDLGDLAVASGLAEPVLDVDRIELTYRDVDSMVQDLRSCGAINVAAGRRPTLTGRKRWVGFEQALLRGRSEGRFPLTIELILGQAWGTGRARGARAGSSGEAAVAVSDIGIIRRSQR